MPDRIDISTTKGIRESEHIWIPMGDGTRLAARIWWPEGSGPFPAILEYTRDMIFLENRQLARLTRDSYQVSDLDGELLTPEIHSIAWDPVSAVKGEYKHFMQKEIFEQPRALIDTLGGRADFENGRVHLPEMNLTPELAQRLNKIFIVACGTSYYSGLVGKFMIESIARIPVEAASGSA